MGATQADDGSGVLLEDEEEEDDLGLLMAIGEEDDGLAEEAEETGTGEDPTQPEDQDNSAEVQPDAEALADQLEDAEPSALKNAMPHTDEDKGEDEEDDDDLALLMAIGEEEGGPAEEIKGRGSGNPGLEGDVGESDTDEAEAAAEALADQLEERSGPATLEGNGEEDAEEDEDDLALLLSLQDDADLEAVAGSLPQAEGKGGAISDSRPDFRKSESVPSRSSAHAEQSQPRRARPSKPAAAFVQVGKVTTHRSSRALQPGDSRANRPQGGTQQVYKGFRVKRPLVSSVILSEKLEEAGYVTLSTLQRQKEPPASWATMAVLGSKSKPKSSSSGKPFMVVKLTDLQQNFTSLFLFGSAYKDLWMEPEGTVFAIFSAKMRVENDGSKSLSADSADQILKVGTSSDFGWCKGTRKDGSKCTMPVNVRECQWCHFHAADALKRLQSKRPGFINTGITRDFKKLNNTLRQKVMGDGFGSGLRPDGLGVKRKREKMHTEPAEPRDSVPGTKASMGAKYLNASIQKRHEDEQARQASQLAKLEKRSQKKTSAISAPKSQSEVKCTPKGPENSKKPIAQTTGSKAYDPPPSRGFVDLDGDSDDDIDGAKSRARAFILANGGMAALRKGARFGSQATKASASRPPIKEGATGLRTVPASKGKLMAKRSSQLLGKATTEQPQGKKAKPSGKDNVSKRPASGFAAAFGAVVDGMDDNIESRYKSEADLDEDDAIAKTLAFAEQKDKAATHLEGVTEITVNAWDCIDCSRLMDVRCKHHNGSYKKVTKRFFVCGSCNRRETTLNRRLPNHKCNYCKATNWKKSAMRQESKSARSSFIPAAVVSREDLKPRGHEHAFSLQQNLTLES